MAEHFELPIVARDGRIYFRGTGVPVDEFLHYVLAHGPRETSIKDFLRDFPQVTADMVWTFVEYVHDWSALQKQGSWTSPDPRDMWTASRP